MSFAEIFSELCVSYIVMLYIRKFNTLIKYTLSLSEDGTVRNEAETPAMQRTGNQSGTIQALR